MSGKLRKGTHVDPPRRLAAVGQINPISRKRAVAATPLSSIPTCSMISPGGNIAAGKRLHLIPGSSHSGTGTSAGATAPKVCQSQDSVPIDTRAVLYSSSFPPGTDRLLFGPQAKAAMPSRESSLAGPLEQDHKHPRRDQQWPDPAMEAPHWPHRRAGARLAGIRRHRSWTAQPRNVRPGWILERYRNRGA
jgi:hypothetical protein